MKINAIKCLGCGDTIFSRSRHDFRTCTCKNLSIDGGFDYSKVSFNPEVGYEHIDLDIDVEKKDLFNDYNYGLDNYGLIRGNNGKV